MEWIYKLDDPILETLGGCVAIFVLVIIATRIIGLRSFAKFTTYDFAFTIAVGSLISAILSTSTTLAHGFTAIFGLLVIKLSVSALQRKMGGFDNIFSNKPILLMDGPEILHQNLASAHIQEEQLIAKLRNANVLNFDQVIAVVLETTGDISVLHKSSQSKDENFEQRILTGVSDKGRKKSVPTT